MKVLVATRDGVGIEEHDEAHTIEGELVRVPFEPCDIGDCWCRRAFEGLASDRITTVAKVVDRPDLTRERYVELHLDAYRERLEAGPWEWQEGDFDEGGRVREALEEEIQWLIDVAGDNEPGSLVRRDGDATTYYPPGAAAIARVIQRHLDARADTDAAEPEG